MHLGKRGEFVVLIGVSVLIVLAGFLLIKGGFTGASVLDNELSVQATCSSAGPVCPCTVDEDINLTGNTEANGTCFTIGASHIIIDGAGYKITGDGTGFGINNGGGYHNVTIINFTGIDNFSTGIGVEVNSNDMNISHNTFYDDDTGINFFGSGVRNFVYNNTINTSDNAINANTLEQIVIKDNNLFIRNGNTGIELVNINYSNISHNNFTMSGGSDIGINIENIGFENLLWNNSFVNPGTAFRVLYRGGSSNIFFNNTIEPASQYSIFLSNASNWELRENVIIGGHIDILNEAINNTFDSNQQQSGNYYLINNATDNIFLNNNLSDCNLCFTDDSLNGMNTMIYNNSYGQINWTKVNLSTSLNLSLGETIFIEDELIGLVDNPVSENLNSSAMLRFYSVSYNYTPWLMKDEIRCDNSDICNITYYQGMAELHANISSFSNYTINESINNAPNITNITLSPTLVYTDINITAFTNYTDNDGDTATIYFQWFFNDSNVHNHTIATVSNGTEVNSTLYYENYSKNEIVNVSVYADDSRNNSTIVESESINVSNSVPTHDIPVLNSSSVYNFTNEVLTVYNISTNDTDDDEVRNIYNWYLNDSSIIALNMPFNGGSNGSWTRDYSPNANNVTDGIATYAASGGYYGGYYYFNGSTDRYLNISNHSTLNFNLSNNEAFTVELAFKSSDQVGKEALLIKGNLANNSSSYYVYRVSNSKKLGYRLANGTHETVLTGTTEINDSTWHHLAFFVNPSNNLMGAFIDGEYDNSGSIDLEGEVGVSGDLIIGKTNNNLLPWNGTVDELRIWNRSLSNTQINLLKNRIGYVLRSSETEASDIWRVEVIPNDGESDGIVRSTNNVTIETITCGEVAENMTLVEDISATGDCFTVTSDNIYLDLGGYTVTGNYSGVGINVTGYDNFTLKDGGSFARFEKAVYVKNSVGHNITNLSVGGGNYAFWFEDVNESSIYHNWILRNNYSLNFTDSYYNNVSNNNFRATISNVHDNADHNNWNLSYQCIADVSIVGGDCWGGNFWNSYNGTDDGTGSYPYNETGDGVGDNEYPYNSSENITYGGDYLPLVCVENWTCGSWSSCSGSLQGRSCSDENSCGTTVNKPVVQRSCSSGGSSGSGGSSSSSGGSSAAPSDSNPAGTTTGSSDKPKLPEIEVPKTVLKAGPEEVKKFLADQKFKIIKKKVEKKEATSTSSGSSSSSSSSSTSSGGGGSSSSGDGSSSGSSSSLGFQEITFEFQNNAEMQIELTPVVSVSSDVPLPNKEKIEEKIKQEVLAELEEEGLSNEELGEIVETKLQVMERIEQEEIKPILVNKVSSPLGGLLGSSNSIPVNLDGSALLPKLTGASDDTIVINPGDEVDLSLELKDIVTLKGADVNVDFNSDGSKVHSEKIRVSGSGNSGPKIVVDTKESGDAMDVYMVVPQSGTFYISYSFRARNDNLAVLGGSYLNLLFNHRITVLSEEYLGPYEITRDEGFIFAQALQKPIECNQIGCVLVASVQDEKGNIVTDYTGDVPAWMNVSIGQTFSESEIKSEGNEVSTNELTGAAVSDFKFSKNVNFVYVLMIFIAITLMFVYSSKVKRFTASTIVRMNKNARRVDHNYNLQDKIASQQKALDKELSKLRK